MRFPSASRIYATFFFDERKRRNTHTSVPRWPLLDYTQGGILNAQLLHIRLIFRRLEVELFQLLPVFAHEFLVDPDGRFILRPDERLIFDFFRLHVN